MARPVVDLPQPDSPTSPSVSPRLTANETPSTACTAPTLRWKMMPCVSGKCMTRLLTSSSARRPLPEAVAGCACAVRRDGADFARIPPAQVRSNWLRGAGCRQRRGSDVARAIASAPGDLARAATIPRRVLADFFPEPAGGPVAGADFAAAAGSSARTFRARSCSAARTGTCPADRSDPAEARESARACSLRAASRRGIDFSRPTV